MLRLLRHKAGAPLILIAGVVAVFWKLVLTSQYSFLEFYDDANQVLPWLQLQVVAIRHGSLLLWDPYEWAGQTLVGQLQPGVFSPFTYLLALFPLDPTGHIYIYSVHVWFVLLHAIAALSAYFLFRDLGCRKPAAIIGGLFYATAGFLGNTPWPQMVEAALWTPLVFLFLLRSLGGRAPLKNAALAGVALGLSWLGGHHGPSLTLTFAAFAVCIYFVIVSSARRGILLRTAVLFFICGLVAAPQILPSIEYGQRAIRWTSSGIMKWDDEIPYTEHDRFALAPPDLLHIALPGGTSLMGDPFTGVVALSLAALALCIGHRRREVRVFFALALGGLLYALARADFLYGILYSLVPIVRKAREPILALSIFQFGIAGLVAFGAEQLAALPDHRALNAIKRALLWFAGAIFALFLVRSILTSQMREIDPRIGMIALIALLLAAAFQAFKAGAVRPMTLAWMVGLLLLLEQGNETGSEWKHKTDKAAVFLSPLATTQDLADFLKQQPGPLRVEMDRKEIAFNFGDWYGIGAVAAYTPTAPAETLRLNWWQDRMAQLYGIGYTIARKPTRPGQQDLFTGRTGFKVFRNPRAFPRAWAVHRIVVAPDEDRGANLVRDGAIDLKTTAVVTGDNPPVEDCAAPDEVTSVDETPSRVTLSAQMKCAGMIVISDSWFPGWRATVDGRPARIWKMDTAFRGVILPAGPHRVEMNYRPLSVYLGLALALIGFVLAIFLQRESRQRPTSPSSL